MEYVIGTNLHDLVTARRPLRIAAACGIIRQAALGLQYAHDMKTIHRDIKPANLMLTKSESKDIIKILDFGLAKAQREVGDSGELTNSRSGMGTPQYMAPEQVISAAKVDIRADIYSLGCTFYFLLTGRAPFNGSQYEVYSAHQNQMPKPLHLIRPDVPMELSSVVARMLAKDPNDRFEMPKDLLDCLAPFMRMKDPPAKVVLAGSNQETDVHDFSRDSTVPPALTREQGNIGAFKNIVQPPKASSPLDEPAQGFRYSTKKAASPFSLAGLFKFSWFRVSAITCLALLGIVPFLLPKWSSRPPISSTARQTPPPAVNPEPAIIEPSEEDSQPEIEEDRETFKNSLGMEFVSIKPGTFEMGSPDSERGREEDEQLHQVTITDEFYLGIHEVTRGQYRRFTESQPNLDEAWKSPGFVQGDEHPVVNVNYEDALSFAQWLSQKEGHDYSLPTEAEWEYAYIQGFSANQMKVARGANHGFSKEANTEGKSQWDEYPFTAPVGSWRASRIGLYDMLGNVSEWCSDWYAEDDEAVSQKEELAAVMNPLGPEHGEERVHRGGSWRSSNTHCRPAARAHQSPTTRSDEIGMRLRLRKPIIKGTIEVRGLPQFAEVLIDGQESTPVDGEHTLPVGPHKVVVRLNGESLHNGMINVVADAPVRLHVNQVDATLPKRETKQIDNLPPPPEFENSIGMKMIYVGPGRLEQKTSNGSGRIIEFEAYYLSAFEVTREQYAKLKDVKEDNEDKRGESRNEPVTVTFNDAMVFTDLLSIRENRAYSLPTEIEWENACRGGSSKTTDYWYGNDSRILQQYANIDGTKDQDQFEWKAPVGSFPKNPWGFYDMHGNVWEWCRISRDIGVLRGGGWTSQAVDATTVSRKKIANKKTKEGIRLRCSVQ